MAGVLGTGTTEDNGALESKAPICCCCWEYVRAVLEFAAKVVSGCADTEIIAWELLEKDLES